MPSKLTLYADYDFQGRSIEITEDVANLSSLNFNDIASSAIVEGDDAWTIYLDVDYKGTQATLYPGRSYPKLATQNLNDKVSSAKIRRYDSIFSSPDIGSPDLTPRWGPPDI